MTRRRILWVWVCLAGLVGLAAVGLYAYFMVRGEHWFRLRPTSFWRREAQRYLVATRRGELWEPSRLDRALDRLGLLKTSFHPPILTEPRAFAVVQDLLRDGDPDIRRLVVPALASSPTREATRALAATLNDGDVRVRALAMFELLGPVPLELRPEAVETLCAVLRTGAPDSRRLAVLCLDGIGTNSPDAIALLRHALEDPDEGVRLAARQALKQLDPEPGTVIRFWP